MISSRPKLVLSVLLATAACATSPGAVSMAPDQATPARACPDWSRSSREDFSNRNASNFGCADSANFHVQLSDPRDAVRGRGDGSGDGRGAAAAIERLRTAPAKLIPGGNTPAAAASGSGPGA